MVVEDWPSEALDLSVELLSKANGLDTVTFLDVGAHEGETFSFLASCESIGEIDYHGFEPNPEVFSALRKLVDHTDVSGKAVVHHNAVGATIQPVDFRVMNASAVSGILDAEEALIERVPSGDHLTQTVVQIPQVSLDEFVTRERIESVDILKIDTEGYELQVLEGGRGLFGEGRVQVVLAEVFFVRYRVGQSFFWDIATWLSSFGYLFHGLADTRETSQGRLYTGNGIWVSPAVGEKLGYL